MVMHRVQTVFRGVEGLPGVSTFYFDTTDFSAQDANDAVEDFWTAARTAIFNGLNWLNEFSVEQVDETTGDIVSSTPVTVNPQTGGIAGPQAALATQGNLRLSSPTYINGRRVQGRLFLPGVVTGSISEGGTSSTYRGVFDDAAAAMIAAAPWVIFSRTNLTNASVTDAQVQVQFAVLRSRRQ